MHKLSILGVMLLCFVLQSCTYSSPKEAYESNIVGKNKGQKTDAKTSRRAPEGNINTNDSSSSEQINYNSKRSNDSYETPAKKEKRRPILNLNELNALMDKEASVSIAEKAPKIDENSKLEDVIKYNKKHKNPHKKAKKRIKLLVVKKNKLPEKIATAVIPNQAVSTGTDLPKVATKTTVNKPVSSVKKVKDPVAVASINPASTEPIVKQVAIPNVELPATKAPAINLPAPVVTVPAIVPAPAIKAPALAVVPTTAPPITEAIALVVPTPVPDIAPVPAVPSSAAVVDTSKMIQQELEQHLKDQLNNKKELIGNEDYQGSSNPSSSIPLPAIPNATESNIDSGLSRLNGMFIDCYFAVKHTLMSLVSRWLGFEW
jgi:hypothetical protein